MNADERILMVYNADGDAISVLVDAVQKIMAPTSYPCSLCSVAYGPIAMRGKWRQYLGGLQQETKALHRDEFQSEYGNANIALPAILSEAPDGSLKILLSKPKLDSLGDVDELIAAMNAALAQQT